MPDARNLITICETNPVLALLKQRNRHYPLEIIHRLFRDEHAVEAPIEDFLRVCAAVREELQIKEGGGNYLMTPQKMLELWCGGARDDEPWFAMTDDPRRGKLVSLRTAARSALEIAISLDDDADKTSGSSTRAYFSDITGAAAHLRQDGTTTVERLRAEIEERKRQIKEIETVGLKPASEEDRERYAVELATFVSTLLTTIGKVPSRLRENLRQAREAFNSLDGSHGDIIRQILEMLTEERSRPGYRMLQVLNEIHNSPRERELVEEAINTLVEECAPYMSERTRREARSLFRSLSDVSLRILSEDHEAACQMANLVQSETFERRLGQSRLLMELSEKMRANPELMRLRLRGPSEMPGFTMGVEREEGVKIHWFDLHLAETPPAPPIAGPERPASVALDLDEARAELEASTAKSAYLDSERLTKWITKIVARNGPTPLSRIIGFRPLKYGLDEVASFMDAALTMIPSRFNPGWEIELAIEGRTNIGEEMPVCEPGQILLIRCQDPVFLPEGAPGMGLADAKRPRVDRAHLRQRIEAIRAISPEAQDSAMRVIRPEEVAAA